MRNCVDSYCSRECCSAHHAVKNATICAQCGKPKNRNNKYCSAVCRNAARSVKPLKACPQCGVMFAPKTSRSTFCSRECANRAHSKKMRGKGNPHYRDGTSYAKWFTEMRPLILERDKHICVTCGQREQKRILYWMKRPIVRTNLIIHHIDENPRNNVADNLVTMCKTCHAVHHKSSTTPFPQLQEYTHQANLSMTYRLRTAITSLQKAYLSTTA